MKVDIFSSCTSKELVEKLHMFRMEIFNCTVNKRFVDKSELGKRSVVKKNVARILTLLRQRRGM